MRHVAALRINANRAEVILDFTLLQVATSQHAAIRRRRRLQPAGGPGDTIFPPTYPVEGRSKQAQHVFERRQIEGEEVWCALIDSVQSQANRLEDALLALARRGLRLPRVVVDFGALGFEGLREVSSFDAPHRLYDAILRDSLLDDTPFMKSPLGISLQTASMRDATSLFETSQNALLFGAWNSTGEGGGLGAKFPRCLVSEIVAIGTPVDPFIVNERTGEANMRSASRRTSSRIDPLGILKKVEVYKSKSGWAVDKSSAGKDAKLVRPSEINHSNISPRIVPLGVTMRYGEHSAVISMAALRRLSFGTEKRDGAARTMLAALGLVALLEQDREGYALRSRCDLVGDGPAVFELVAFDGSTTTFDIDLNAALSLYDTAFDTAVNVGFTLSAEPIRLVPQTKLVEIVRKSRELALEGEGEAEDSSADA